MNKIMHYESIKYNVFIKEELEEFTFLLREKRHKKLYYH